MCAQWGPTHGPSFTRLLCPWGFSRQEYWSGLPFPSPGDLSNPGTDPLSPTLASRFFTTGSHQASPVNDTNNCKESPPPSFSQCFRPHEKNLGKELTSSKQDASAPLASTATWVCLSALVSAGDFLKHMLAEAEWCEVRPCRPAVVTARTQRKAPALPVLSGGHHPGRWLSTPKTPTPSL